MVLEVLVCDELGQQQKVDVDDVALLFFDTFLAAVCPSQRYDCFQYVDDEGDLVAVRTDVELATMLASHDPTLPLRIYIKENASSDVVPWLEPNAAHMMPESIRRLSVVSSGRSGTVYKSVYVERDEIIAVKCIMIDGSAEAMCEVLRETNILRTCSSSPFVVNFFGAMLLDGELCLCIEFMDGGSLDRYGKLPNNVLGPVTVSVINGLSFLWSKKVMHRDIKPSNFLVNSQGNVKLSDFGVSKQLDQSVARSFVGTNAYMAPERLFGGPYRICSDIWSVGVSLCEMAMGKFPLAERDEGLSVAVQRVASGNVDVSQQLKKAQLCVHFCELVLNCVIVDERRRWSPQTLLECSYVKMHTPIDCTAVAEFVHHKCLLL
uniref:mitogen-activated protein kinase kinase n=1 Tax=Parascaris univalens TaxID=6257 RepID=A0A915B4H5_PARUN